MNEDFKKGYDLQQEYIRFKIVGDMKKKQTDSLHEKNMIDWRLERLKARYDVYNNLSFDLEIVRKKEKLFLNKILKTNQAINWNNVYQLTIK